MAVSVGSHENLLDKLLGSKSPFIPSLHLFTTSSKCFHLRNLFIHGQNMAPTSGELPTLWRSETSRVLGRIQIRSNYVTQMDRIWILCKPLSECHCVFQWMNKKRFSDKHMSFGYVSITTSWQIQWKWNALNSFQAIWFVGQNPKKLIKTHRMN